MQVMAVILHRLKDGTKSYASRTLAKAAVSYSQINKEGSDVTNRPQASHILNSFWLQ